MDDGFGFLDDGSLRIPDPDAFPPPASMSPKKGGGCSGGCGGSSATSVADADVVDSIFDEPCCSSCAMGWPCDGTCGGKCGQERPEEVHCCPSCMMGWPCEKDADVQARAELFGYTAECVGETCT